jgi:hypothetical protein
MLVMLDRGDYWQCAYVISKGGRYAAETARHRGDFAAIIVWHLSPWLADRARTT